MKRILITGAVVLALVVMVAVLVTGDDTERTDIEPAGPISEIDPLQPDQRVDADAPGAVTDSAGEAGGHRPGGAEGPTGDAAPTDGGDGSDGGRPAAERPAAPSGSGSPPSEGAGSGTAGSAGAAEADRPTVAQSVSTDEILRATSRRYEDVRALQAEFRQELVNPLLGTRTRSAGTLFQRQPDRFLMRFSDPANDVIVSDGRYFWLYFPSVDEKQVIRSSRGAQGLDLRSQFVGDPVERFDATYNGRESVRGRPAHVLTLDPRQPAGYESLKVWIDAEDHLVRRFELTESTGNIRHFELSDIRLNPSLPDRLFEFTPPAGAHVVDRG